LYRRLEAHDKNQIELKLAYPIDPSKRRQKYRVESFLFIPRSLGITKTSYPPRRFYEDTAAFVRLKTPIIALRALARDDDVVWTNECRDHLERLLRGDRTARSGAIRRLKLLGCMFKSAFRDESAQLLDRFEGVQDLEGEVRTARRASIAETAEAFVSDAEDGLQRLQQVGHLAEQAAMSRRVHATWRAVDEYVSLAAEEALTAVVVAIDRVSLADDDDSLVQAREHLATAAVDTYRYRRGKGYPSFIRPGTENEAMPYQRRLLKKIISSVLYLDVERAEAGRWSDNLIGAVAAATAMAFAVATTIYATVHFEMASVAFVSIAIGSYIVKDRIKDLAKAWMGDRMARWLPDHRVRVCDRETGEVLGVAQETVITCSASAVDPEILRARHAENPGLVARDARPETVVHWTKDVRLESDALAERLVGLDAIHDIVRFNFHRLRRRMDDAYELHRIVEPTTRRIRDVRCSRVYHLNLVLRLTFQQHGEQRVEIDHVRVVMDQRGIRRVEEVAAELSPSVVRSTMPPLELVTDANLSRLG
jgi:hypothetical protein